MDFMNMDMGGISIELTEELKENAKECVLNIAKFIADVGAYMYGEEFSTEHIDDAATMSVLYIKSLVPEMLSEIMGG